MNSTLLLLPVLIPLLAGTLVGFYTFPTKKIRSIFIFLASLLNSLVILLLLLIPPAEPLPLFSLTKEFPFTLRLDGAGMIFLALIAFLWPLAVLYALEYMAHEDNQHRFFGFYLISYGVTAGVALSANLLTMYFFYELLTLSTVLLVGHDGNRRAMAAARKYIIYSMGGAALSLTGILMLYSRTGAADFHFGGFAAKTSPDSFLLTAYLLTFFGFGVKAAVFPLHAWLPAAGVAPTPVTALLHAVAVVKSGVFACIRSTFYAFGPGLLSGTWAQKMVLAMTAFTIVYGSAMALREQHLKRRLAYSTVSNLSYILFGMALMTTSGLTAAFSHMLFHGIIKITLFFCAGTVLCKTGREYVPQLTGHGRKMPLTFLTFTLSALALTGTPLLPGFISKMNLITAAAALGGGWAMTGVVALLLSALLTAAYLLPISVRAFLVSDEREPKFTERDRDPGMLMLIPFAVLCLTMAVLGTHAVPVMDLLAKILAGS